MGAKSIIKFKILFHLIKGKISLIPMETIFIIPKKFEYLERLIKLAKRKKDSEGQKN